MKVKDLKNQKGNLQNNEKEKENGIKRCGGEHVRTEQELYC